MFAIFSRHTLDAPTLHHTNIYTHTHTHICMHFVCSMSVRRKAVHFEVRINICIASEIVATVEPHNSIEFWKCPQQLHTYLKHM